VSGDDDEEEEEIGMGGKIDESGSEGEEGDVEGKLKKLDLEDDDDA
jgi:hypothetical protein